MTINKGSIEELLSDNFDMCSEPFDDFEAEHIFSCDEGDFTCERVTTGRFSTSVSDFEVEIDEDSSVCVKGTGSASYNVTGSFFQYDDVDSYGYLDCASDNGQAFISFTIFVDSENYSNSDVEVEVT